MGDMVCFLAARTNAAIIRVAGKASKTRLSSVPIHAHARIVVGELPVSVDPHRGHPFLSCRTSIVEHDLELTLTSSEKSPPPRRNGGGVLPPEYFVAQNNL